MKIRKSSFSKYGRSIFRGAGVMAVLAATFFVVDAQLSHASATVSFHDFSALKGATIPSANQYSQLYYTDSTTITVASVAGDATEGQVIFDNDAETIDNTVSNIVAGEKLNVLIKNSSAQDASGEPLDVVISIDDVNQWNSDTDDDGNPDAYAGITFSTNFQYADSNTIVTTSTDDEDANVHSYDVGEAGTPIIFWANSRFTDEQVTVRYFVQDSYNAETDTGTMAGITDVSTMMWDFDVPLSEARQDAYSGELMYGNEGVRFDNGTVSAYYDTATTGGDDGWTVNTNEDSYWVSSANTAAFNGIYYKDSIFATTSGLTDEFRFTYSASAAGIGIAIASPVPYETEAPVKSVSKTTAAPGDSISYAISQTIPANAYNEADYNLFRSLNYAYNYFTNKAYESLVISDTFDSDLSISSSSIKITNESGTDASSLFGIAVDTTTNKVAATARDADDEDLYGHTFKLTVPVKISSATSATTISNVATTTARYENDLDDDIDLDLSLSSNTVSTVIDYNYTIIYDANNDSATGVMGNQICKTDVDCQLVSNAYAASGYTFTGWNTAADGSGTSYADLATVKNLAANGESITLYAQWEEDTTTDTSSSTTTTTTSASTATATPTPTATAAATTTSTSSSSGASAPDTGAMSVGDESYAERAAVPIAAIVFAPVAIWVLFKVVRNVRKKNVEWYDNWE